jgi:hypothetical protein
VTSFLIGSSTGGELEFMYDFSRLGEEIPVGNLKFPSGRGELIK